MKSFYSALRLSVCVRRQIFPAAMLALGFLVISPRLARASVVDYNNLAAFQAASNTSVQVTFGAFVPKDTNVFIPPTPPYTEGGVTFTPIDSFPIQANLYVAAPGGACSNCFGNPISPIPVTQNILTASGNEHFNISFAAGPTAVGWDSYTNAFKPPIVTVFDTSNILIGTFTLTQAPDTLGFFGVTSTSPIGHIEWLADHGWIQDTGLAKFRVGSQAPEPSTVLLLITGLVGISRLGRKRFRK